MIDIDIPDFRHLLLENLVVDFNGTLAKDGVLLPGVVEKLREIAGHLKVHVVTADTFGLAEQQLQGLPVTLTILAPEAQTKAKRFYALSLGSETVVAIGNGRNDQQLLASASLGILVIQGEGAAGLSLGGADVITLGILDALDLLLHPQRLLATLRS